MQTGYTGYIDRSEWWWVSLVSTTFIVIGLIPYLLIAIFSQDAANYQFMGSLHDHMGAASVMARMYQGASGQFLQEFLYSSQPQDGIIIHPLYVLVGQLQNFTELSIPIFFHVIRIFVSLFMFMSIYFLGANIWVKTRPRRIFFILASVGAGLGWILAPIFAITDIQLSLPDLTIPQIFPIFAASANIHYPMAIASVSILVGIIIPALRPGETLMPAVNNGGALVFSSSLILALVYPDALLPLGIAYAMNVIINGYIDRKFHRNQWYWGLWITVPALPIVAYNLIIYFSNPYYENWINQRGNLPNPILLMLSLGLVLLLALPGLWRACRRFERDGDRFMLLWLLSMLATAYLPLRLSHYFLLGLTLPVAYFAARSVEDFWFKFIRRLHQPRVYLVVFPFLILSHLIWMYFPVYPIIAGWHTINAITLEADYIDAFEWLEVQSNPDDVVLASSDASLWIPSQSTSHVVFGHPDETFMADQTMNEVTLWYRETDADRCTDLVERYSVDYIIYGAREMRLGAGTCLSNYPEVERFGTVRVYTIRD